MATPPYFPFYVKDFVADAKVQQMTTEEIGAYILLLCSAWQEDPPGSLVKDDAVLARIARLDSHRWSLVKTRVLAAFVLGTDDRYHQPRLRSEFHKANALIKKRKAAGEKGGRSRWQTHGKAISKANDKSISNGSGYESASSPKEGGLGETAPAVRDGPAEGQTWGGFLSREWRFFYRGTAPSQRDGETLVPYFDDFAKRLAPEKIRDGIRDKDRNGSQPTWDFEKWVLAKLGITNGRATDKPITRISAQPGSVAAIKRKTIRVGSESDQAGEAGNSEVARTD